MLTAHFTSIPMSPTGMMQGPPPASVGPSFERFLHELVMAWKKLASYPQGHPLRAGAVETAHRELRLLLDLGKPVDIGVSKEGLSWGEERVQTVGSRQIAEALYLSNIAVLRFTAELREAELEAFLLGLRARPAEAGAETLPARLATAGV